MSDMAADTTIAEAVQRAAERWPGSIALVDVGSGEKRDVRTFVEIALAGRRAAAGLASRGVAPGDRVAVIGANDASFVAAWIGIAHLGATVVPIPVLSAPPEIEHRLRHARCAAVVADDERMEIARRAAIAAGTGVVVGMTDLDGGRDVAPADPSPAPRGAPAMILYTSGTTGTPKGACIGQRALLVHTRAVAEHALRLGPEDRVLCALPLTHSYGVRMAMLAPLLSGATSVLVRRFDASATLAIARREGITWIPAVPTMLAAWAETAADAPPGLRWCLSAGAPLADDVRTRAEARLGAPVRQGYGLTEATFATIDAPPDAPAPGSVGRPVRGIEVRIVAEDGHALGAGAAGEVQVRGANVMDGYLDDEESTRAAFDGEWLRTGDIGRLDGEGRLYIVDRLKDLILRGGNNVYPSEVEAALAAHPAIADVAVVGRPDPYYGEEVVAVIVARGAPPAIAEVDAWARARLAPHKVPRAIAFVDALPLGPSRKVVKRELRERLASGELRPTAVR